MVEQNLCPLTQIISSLVEVSSLMETTSPLDQVLVRICFFFTGTKISVVELLFPPFVFNLISGVEESAVGCLELGVSWNEISTSLGTNAHV